MKMWVTSLLLQLPDKAGAHVPYLTGAAGQEGKPGVVDGLNGIYDHELVLAFCYRRENVGNVIGDEKGEGRREAQTFLSSCELLE